MAKPLLAELLPERFVGRREELERVYTAAVSGLPAGGTRVSASPGVGASELLRQVFDRLFFEQRFCLPFYFELKPSDASAADAASRYLYHFLLQAIAFRRGEPEIILTQPEICDLVLLAPPADTDWVSAVKDICQRNGPLHDDRAFLRTALSAPLKAFGQGIRVFPMIDGLQTAALIEKGRMFIEAARSSFASAKISFVLSADDGYAIGDGGSDQIKIAPLSREDMANVIAAQAAEADLQLSDHARDLIAVQSGSRPALSRVLVEAARESKRPLESFRDVEQTYADELIGGRIGSAFDERLRSIAPDAATRRKLVESLYLSLEPGKTRFPLGSLRERLGLDDAEFVRLVDALAAEGFIAVESDIARLDDDVVFRDFIDSRYRLGKTGVTAGAVRAHIVTKAIGRAPQLMERVYRKETSLDLDSILLTFDLQEVPTGLLDYRRFRDSYKGLGDDEIQIRIAAETQKFTLPQFSHAAPLAEHIPAIGIAEPERVVVAVGFEDRAYRAQDKVTWLAAEIDSKLEAEYELTQSWIDRLTSAAEAAGFERYRVWLISPEGFTNDALDLLQEHDGIGSSRRQVEFLRTYLTPGSAGESENTKEYEMVIPVGDDAELISAHSLEEIARRHDFPAKAVNQIKTALVEACINASEHGKSPDRRIYQKFAVDDEKIVITVSNRGVRIKPRDQEAAAAESAGERTGRRGWGLELIRRLMDEVRVEQVDDGTRILMTKYLRGSRATA